MPSTNKNMGKHDWVCPAWITRPRPPISIYPAPKTIKHVFKIDRVYPIRASVVSNRISPGYVPSLIYPVAMDRCGVSTITPFSKVSDWTVSKVFMICLHAKHRSPTLALLNRRQMHKFVCCRAAADETRRYWRASPRCAQYY